jgi:hypothetical protein
VAAVAANNRGFKTAAMTAALVCNGLLELLVA